jgi:catechol 2,3-dioxygenase-like lactoylglutathione lyase family enzyme
MSIRFNHTLVHCKDKAKSSAFLVEILGVKSAPKPYGPFLMVGFDNESSLDFLDAGDYAFQPQHYAFLIDEAEFDAIFARIRARGLDYWADPHKQKPGEINRNEGGRGVYFDDPDGHLLEILTRPYGSSGG